MLTIAKEKIAIFILQGAGGGPTCAIKLNWLHTVKLLSALGVSYLHSLHPVIVHRDLKPSNLLMEAMVGGDEIASV
jgi:serine/threonine protein kinase